MMSGPMTDGRAGVGAQAFPRRSRLLKPAEFKTVFDRPVVSSDHLFKVFARPGTSPHYRLGLAVSRKVDRRAVGRNRIKRVIRESFRVTFPLGDQKAADQHSGGQHNAGQGRDFVIVASPQAAKVAGEQLRSSLAKHWQTIDRKIESRTERNKQQANRPEE